MANDIQIYRTIKQLNTCLTRKQRDLAKHHLALLELDLLEFYAITGTIHSVEQRLLDYYHKLWEI